MADLNRLDGRGVKNPTCSGRYKKSQARVRERTSRLASDLVDLFPLPTGPHIAAFILPQAAGRLVLVDAAVTFAKVRSDKKQIKHHGSRFGACLLQSICRLFGDGRCITSR
jgi:hypothetical protein